MLKAALWYAKKGWPVFPLHSLTPEGGCTCRKPQCSSPAKHPRTQNGLQDATTDHEVVKEWWTQWPDANVGLATGEKSGLFFLDVDPRHGGDDAIFDLKKKYGEFPSTIESLTGAGGCHVGFRWPGFKVKNSANDLGPGLDIRGDGGYIVAPPSVHHSGKKYCWEVDGRPNEKDPASAPDWLLNFLREAPSLKKTFHESEIISEGGRNNTLTTLAGAMRRKGMSEKSILAALREENQSRCIPPLPEEEVAGIAKSVSRYNPSCPVHQSDEKNAPAEKDSHEVELIRGCDVEIKAVDWLWEGWLAAGKLHILAGVPGTGKTTIGMALAATITSGGRWPDGNRSPKGNVLIWSGEDDPGDTLAPRLVASGADLDRVFFIKDVREGNEKRVFDPAKDMEALKHRLCGIAGGVSLMIVDPIVSAVAGDSHKNAETRRSLQPLVDLAAAVGCALLGISHFAKNTGGREPVDRLIGSVAFGAVPRVALVAAKSQPSEGEEGQATRLLLRAKSNIGPDDGGFRYDLQQSELKERPGIFASSVLWGEPIVGAAREILAEAESVEKEEGGALGEAKIFLADLLTNGALPQKTVKEEATGAGLSWSTIRRAKEALGVKPRKIGMDSGWEWHLPPRCSRNSEDAQQNNVGTFEQVEHLPDLEVTPLPANTEKEPPKVEAWHGSI